VARANLYRSLTPWQRVSSAASQPSGLTEFVADLFTNFIEIHATASPTTRDDDRIGRLQGQPVLLVGHIKGGDTKEKIFRNFGYARPRGTGRRFARCAAEKFRRPILVFVDTPAPIRVSSRKSEASPRRLPSTCAR